ncbi:SsrA-binding protein SmpB [Chlorobium sp. N1]|uniref:SsrA-binding protein SmpB n=1 Tax=Chlorobium sp. N1 TaxID=2491138 RepID=UPI00104054C7|nr:SsrA-binding protein SmpB [Chlorobium sp. N1]TCD47087.1 SsrA-binding protein SmpB [Chlorobium sp. N1]
MAKKEQKRSYAESIQNRKARYEYQILETIVAGIELLGSEVKSVRLGKASLNESYAGIRNGEIWLENMQITPYEFNRLDELDPRRSRRLLLHRREIERLKSKIDEKGLTLIPLKAFFSPKGILKVELALAKGKKLYDKREAIKGRENERQLRQIRKQY